jgi:hypothetical protein
MPSATVRVTGREAARRRFSEARSAMRTHARAEVASACRACGEPTNALRSTRRFCSSPCRQRAYRTGRRPMLAPLAHQRRIREREAALDPRPIMASLEGCAVVEVPFAEAKALIVRYACPPPPRGDGLWDRPASAMAISLIIFRVRLLKADKKE